MTGDWEKNFRWQSHTLEFANNLQSMAPRVEKKGTEGGEEAKMKNLNTCIWKSCQEIMILLFPERLSLHLMKMDRIFTFP